MLIKAVCRLCVISSVYCSQLKQAKGVFSSELKVMLIFSKIAEFNVAEIGIIK